MDMAVQNDIAAAENRSKLLGSNLFGDPKPKQKQIHQQIQPQIQQIQQVQNIPQMPPQQPNFVRYAPRQTYIAAPRIILPQIDNVAAAEPLPTLSAFPDFKFDTFSVPESFDLGVKQKQQIPQTFAEPQKLTLTSVDKMRQMRDEIQREGDAFCQRIKNMISSSESEKRPVYTSVSPVPQIETTTEFFLPDGSSFQD